MSLVSGLHITLLFDSFCHKDAGEYVFYNGCFKNPTSSLVYDIVITEIYILLSLRSVFMYSLNKTAVLCVNYCWG